ncbi:hypothetical protein ACWEN6_05095 [Sphaerisporangium sp. NPDC004334]
MAGMDVSAAIADRLAVPLAAVFTASDGAAELRDELNAEIVDRVSAVWANAWRGVVWFFFLAVAGLLSILMRGIGIPVKSVLIYSVGDIAGYIAFFSLMPVITHSYRAGIAWYLLPKDGRPSVRMLKWASPKLRDGYIGVLLGVLFVAFAYFGGFGLAINGL